MTAPGSGNDLLMGGKTRSAKLKEIGDVVSGVIIEEPTQVQMRDYVDDKPLWLPVPEGSPPGTQPEPRMQVRVLLQTELREDNEDGEDDGVRALFLKGQARIAARAAVRAARSRGLDVGGKLTVRVTDMKAAFDKKTGKPLNDQKIHEVTYEPPSKSFSLEPAAGAASAEATVASALGGREIVILDGVETDITDYTPAMKEAARKMSGGEAPAPKGKADEPPF